MKEKICLIAGCSHAAGSEIDGTEDSVYNRDHSFGNLFAQKIGYRPVNISSHASSNHSIARSVLEWFDRCYNSETMDVFLLVAWTESTRIDMPVEWPVPYEMWNPTIDFQTEAGKNYIRINLGYKGSHDREIPIIRDAHNFIASYPNFFEIINANLVLQLQYFCKSKNINYMMCNTMHMFTPTDHINFYVRLMDHDRYYSILDVGNSFYFKYKNLGYVNSKAKYWHHGEEPHQLYSKDLYNFYLGKY